MMKRRRTDRVCWFQVGPFPVAIGYAPSLKAREHALAELGIPDEPRREANGLCEYWSGSHCNPEILETVILISLDRELCKTVSMSQVVGMIAHECTHAFRIMREQMQESEPSLEFEAYFIGGLVQHVVEWHSETPGPWKLP